MSLDFIKRLSDTQPILVNVLRGYAALAPTRSLSFPAELTFEVVHSFLLNDILLNPLFTTYPPSPQYQVVFWKWALNNLEKLIDSEVYMFPPKVRWWLIMPKDHEIDTQLYEHYVSLIPTTSPQTVGVKPPIPSYVTYFWESNSGFKTATLLESRTTIETGTTGLKTWLASLVLAQFLITNPELVRSTRVLELGCGVGLLGMIIANLQLSPEYSGGHLYLSDVNAEVLDRCKNNLNLPCNRSSAHPALTCTSLDWTDSLDEGQVTALRSSLQAIMPDMIVGADVVYDPTIIDPLLRSIHLGLQCKPTAMALIALTVRNEDTMAKFTCMAEQCLLVHEIRPELADTQDFWGPGHYDSSCSQTVKIFCMKVKHVC
ncbi:hypothetical protein NM688_g1877 [Phlebia brevispora]|uniref:Uncharacterized protein n=1 Tax=Phlebia brevispora TaxID=194682 RepID=A0ACC1TAG8_9APHY|nr:hypothetical protein NM688_g1877 [Phlebia brevispora]